MKRTMAIAVVVLAVTATTAWAETATATPAQVTKLQKLVGTWHGMAKVADAGKAPVEVAVDFQCRQASGGSGVSCDTRFAMPGGDYLETDLFGWNAEDGKVHWYAVTNAGEVHDHAGNFDGEKLTVHYAGTSGGKPITEDVTLEPRSGGEIAFDVVSRTGGAVSSTMNGKVTRR